MKKIVSLFLSVLIAAALCACSGGAPGSGAENAAPGHTGTAAASDTNSAADSGDAAPGTSSNAPVEGSEGLKTAEYDDNALMITGPGGFTGTELVIPSHVNGVPVVKIEESAFEESNITSLSVPWTVLWISEDAFEGCGDLTSVTLSEGNLGIGESAFSGCKSLKGVTVPSTVESVGRSAFAGCLSLEEVTFSGCTSVDKYAFSECTSLRCVVYEGSAGKPYSVSSGAFSKAAALERVEFSEGLGELGQFCFEDCAALKTVYLPKSLTSVAPNAFSGTALEKVYYAGSESEWNAITIGGGNDALKNAAVEFNKTR